MVAPAELTIGSKVLVTWGLDEVEGIVEDRYAGAAGLRFRVRVPLLDPDGDELEHLSLVLPAKAVRAA